MESTPRFLPDWSPTRISTLCRGHVHDPALLVSRTPKQPTQEGGTRTHLSLGWKRKGAPDLKSLKLEATLDPRAGKFDPPTGGSPGPCPRFSARLPRWSISVPSVGEEVSTLHLLQLWVRLFPGAVSEAESEAAALAGCAAPSGIAAPPHAPSEVG